MLRLLSQRGIDEHEVYDSHEPSMPRGAHFPVRSIVSKACSPVLPSASGPRNCFLYPPSPTFCAGVIQPIISHFITSPHMPRPHTGLPSTSLTNYLVTSHPSQACVRKQHFSHVPIDRASDLPKMAKVAAIPLSSMQGILHMLRTRNSTAIKAPSLTLQLPHQDNHNNTNAISLVNLDT